jgi:protein arginine kinase activator
MICQTCQKNAATVHVTEILPADASNGAPSGTKSGKGGAQGTTRRVAEQHLCEICAQTLDLPHVPVLKKTVSDIWKLLQLSAQQTRRRPEPTCAGCGTTLDQFRRRGRLGCARCYEAFAEQVGELLERVHGARAHVGRVPGQSAEELNRRQRMLDLKQRLEVAIRDEAYESAAKLRDELRALEEGA